MITSRNRHDPLTATAIVVVAISFVCGASANAEPKSDAPNPSSIRLAQRQPYPPQQIPPTTGGAMPQMPQPSFPMPEAGAMPQPNPPSGVLPGSPYPPNYPQPSQPKPPGGLSMPGTGQQQALMPGPTLVDALGRFRIVLPQGTVSVGSTYSFGVPNAGIMIGITSNANDQEFQNMMRSLPMMLQQMGARVESQQSISVRGRQAQSYAVTMVNPQFNVTMYSIGVLIPGPNLWLQVTGQEQTRQRMPEAMQMLLDGVQY